MEINKGKVSAITSAIAAVVHSFEANELEKLVALSTSVEAQSEVLCIAYKFEEKSVEEKLDSAMAYLGSVFETKDDCGHDNFEPDREEEEECE